MFYYVAYILYDNNIGIESLCYVVLHVFIDIAAIMLWKCQ